MDVMLCLQSVFKASPKGEVSNLPAARDHTANTALPPRSGCVVTLGAAGLCTLRQQTVSNRFTSAPIISRSLVLCISRTPSPKWAQRVMVLGQFTHLRSAPRHALYQARLRCEQRAGCRPKVTSSGDSSPFLIAIISSIASISLLLHDMGGL